MSRQKLGQHFLRSSPVLARIVDSLRAQPGDTILEIGPGKGALTGPLLAAGFRVEAVELDPAMVAHLEAQWPVDSAALHVHCIDVLKADLTRWGPVTVAGNLPYYITSPILRRLYSMGTFLRTAVLLMQLEVAERLVAKPGTRDYGFLSVLTQAHALPELLFRVPPGAFHVPPKVQSAVVRITPRNQAVDEAFIAFLGWCFSQKRKTLRNNLRAYFPPHLVDALPQAGLRAEQLELEELHSVWLKLKGQPDPHSSQPVTNPPDSRHTE
ncbi:MAG: 16S rRNA (adenine(1518)-N(6)/adenine(1519)-N(6))-dimethyltransferase RsmA [Bryobacterales bacterium]|nr:16S rRNA (adenine(1518)-N(6)/adenine(1519)-N(6))-dimethyltransferase RsmA [Bryobacterales bacterium]